MFIKSCGKCDEDGFLADDYGFRSLPCECLLNERAKHRLVESGFKKKTIELVSGAYYLPEISEDHRKYIDYLTNNPAKFEEKGLGLYIYSEDRGRGKTTLVHYLMYQACRSFFNSEIYSSDRTFAFMHMEDFFADVKANPDSGKWKATWLVLDDMGNEDVSSEWKKAANISMLQKVLHFRRDECLPILITSNKPPEVISRFYQGVLDSLLEIESDGKLGGISYRPVQVTGAIDLRLNSELNRWED